MRIYDDGQSASGTIPPHIASSFMEHIKFEYSDRTVLSIYAKKILFLMGVNF